MSDQSSLRAGDADRDRTIGVLREAFAEGRLSEQEFNDRMGSAAQARTFGDLAALTADLPSVQLPPPPPVPAVGASAAVAVASQQPPGRAAWVSWASVSVLMIAIWLFTSLSGDGFHGFWPFWVIVPWGAGLLVSWISRRT